MFSAKYSYRGTGFRALMNRAPQVAEASAVEAAEYLADEWRSRVRVDTGSLRDGIHVQTHDTSGYAAAVARAKAANPKVQTHAENPRPARKTAAAVGSVAKHDAPNEYGTRHMPAHPAYVPAVEATRRRFPEIVRRRLHG